MGKIIDETGNVYTYLTVLEKCIKRGIKNKGKKIYWLCKCRCGNVTKVRGSQLRKEDIRSCGCYTGKRFKGEKKDIYDKYDIIPYLLTIIFISIIMLVLFIFY